MLKRTVRLPGPARRLLADRSGSTAIEYGLIAGLICVVLLAGLTGTSTSVAAAYAEVMQRVSEALGGS